MSDNEWIAIKARLDELEQRESFHEITIETLNQCLIEQQREIESLRNELIKLTVKFISVTEESQISLSNEKPPHY